MEGIFSELLDGTDLELPERRWWVLYTRSRQEKAVARQLQALQVPHYLPLVRQRVFQRKIVLEVPLFSGYVFLYGSEHERVLSLTTNRISRVLKVEDGSSLKHDLRQIRDLIAAGIPLTVESQLAPGRRVRIRDGALAGLEGTILERRGEVRLLVNIDFLQQGASIAIDDFRVEAIDAPPTLHGVNRISSPN